jgi:hypothetical protein
LLKAATPTAAMRHHFRSRAGLFAALWLFIAFVSVVDGVLVLRFRHLIETMELNPFGRALIAANGGRVWALLIVKFLGTIAACAALLVIQRKHHALGFAVACGVASLQLCLLLFLLLW